MARHLLMACVIGLALAASGCLRSAFDLCDDPVPHPECALVDGGPDAGASDGAAAPQGDGG